MKKIFKEWEAVFKSLKESPAIPDEDCPELTAEQLSQFARVAEERRKENRTYDV